MSLLSHALRGTVVAFFGLSVGSYAWAASDQELYSADDIALQYHPSPPGGRPVLFRPGLTFGMATVSGGKSHQFVPDKQLLHSSGMEIFLDQPEISWYLGFTGWHYSGEKNRVSFSFHGTQTRFGIAKNYPLNEVIHSFPANFSLEPLAAITVMQAKASLDDSYVSFDDKDRTPGLLLGLSLHRQQLFSVESVTGSLRQTFSYSRLNFSGISYRPGSFYSETTLGVSYAL